MLRKNKIRLQIIYRQKTQRGFQSSSLAQSQSILAIDASLFGRTTHFMFVIGGLVLLVLSFDIHYSLFEVLHACQVPL